LARLEVRERHGQIVAEHGGWRDGGKSVKALAILPRHVVAVGHVAARTAAYQPALPGAWPARPQRRLADVVVVMDRVERLSSAVAWPDGIAERRSAAAAGRKCSSAAACTSRKVARRTRQRQV